MGHRKNRFRYSGVKRFFSLSSILLSCKYRRNSPVSEKIELKEISGIDIDPPPLRVVGGESREARPGTSYYTLQGLCHVNLHSSFGYKPVHVQLSLFAGLRSTSLELDVLSVSDQPLTIGSE